MCKLHSVLVGFFSGLLLLTGAATPASVRARNDISGTLTGTVCKKQDGTALDGVKVKVVNDYTGIPSAGITNSQGEYRIPFLPEGSYSITATKDGFVTESLPNFAVRFGQYNPVTHDKNVKKYHWLAININLSQPTLNGQVSDEAGQSLAGSSVIVRSQHGALTRATLTDQNGGYQFPDLPTGFYSIHASWNGTTAAELPVLLDRKEVWAPPIKIASAANANDRRPAQQPPGQSPSATGGSSQSSRGQASEGEKFALLIHPTDITRSAHFSERHVGSLPLGGATYTRSFDELTLLVAGVAPAPYTPGARGPGVGFGIGTAGQFSVNGMRARSNNFSVDGSDNNDADVGVRRQGFVALVPQSVESVGALSVVTLLWDAELGRGAGGQVNAVSKYGTNSLHGQAYGFFTDARLNARNFFDYTGGAARDKDPFTRTQVGGVIGGPIRRDHTHFFASFERTQVRASTEQHFATPTSAERRFIDLRQLGFAEDKFSVLNSGAVQNFDKQTPPGQTPLGSNIFSLYPTPNHASGPFGANTFTTILPADGLDSLGSLRLTHQVAEKHTLNLRYNLTDDERLLPSVNRAINSALEARTRSHNLSVVLDSAPGLTRFNQARFSFGRTRLNFLGQPGSPFVFEGKSQATITLPQGQSFPIPSRTGPIGELIIEPYSPVGVGVFYFPQDRASNTFQFADTFSWILDKHLVKFGGNFRRYQLNSRLDRLYRPQVVYGGGLLVTGNIRLDNGIPVRNAKGELIFDPDKDKSDPNKNAPAVSLTGVQLASLGAASAVLQTITNGPPDSTVGLRFNENHLFINDNWHVSQSFTMDFGLRYEYSSVPHSADKRIERALALEDLPALGNSRFNTPERTAKFNAAVAAYRRTLGGRQQMYEQDKNNFGPHFGLAWAIDKAGRTALRTGYGIYYDAVLGAVVTQSRNVFPREIPINADPSFLRFDVFQLNNPAFLKIVRDPNDNFTNSISLLRPGTCNQFGIGACNQLGVGPDDFVALLGALFNQNEVGAGLAFTLPEQHLRTPYAQHWHLSVEREVWDDYFLSVAYVGTKGTKLTRLVTPNLGSVVTPIISLARSLEGNPAVILNGLIGSVLGTRPESNLGAYQIYENSAASSYHALQIEARKRYNRGHQFSAAYTWSHAIDDVSDVFTLAGASILPQDFRNLRLERGSANFDLRHRFAASWLWDLPFYTNEQSGISRSRARLLNGWQITGIFHAQTGQPFTLALPFDNNFDGNLNDRPATAAGLLQTNGHGRQRIALAPNLSFLSFTNFDAVNLTAGKGLLGRNTLRGDGFVNLDLAVGKSFDLTEHQFLTFRAEFFNLFNRANFGLPIRVIGAPGFGSAVDTVNPARTFQFALKFNF